MGHPKLLLAEIPEQFARLVNKYNLLQERPFDYGCGEELYPSEIHAVDVIGRHPDVHMAEVARILGVTRGAVQQTVERLMKKGLVGKFMDENDAKKVYLQLTKKGKTAFAGHERYHAELSAQLRTCFDRLRPGEIASLKGFLDKMESSMDTYYEQKFREKKR